MIQIFLVESLQMIFFHKMLQFWALMFWKNNVCISETHSLTPCLTIDRNIFNKIESKIALDNSCDLLVKSKCDEFKKRYLSNCQTSDDGRTTTDDGQRPTTIEVSLCLQSRSQIPQEAGQLSSSDQW